MTQLEMVNKVLRRLREDTVTTVADTSYSQFIAILVNDGMREVSNAYDWPSFTHTVLFDVVGGSGSSYDLSKTVANGGAVIGPTPTNEESFLTFDDDNRPHAYLFESSAASTLGSPVQMNLITESERHRRRNLADNTDTYSYPDEFEVTLNAEGTGMAFKFWQIPSDNRYANIAFWTPQNDLEIDGSDDNTSIVAHNPSVEAYVNMVAANERGEEIGEPGNILEQKYNRILGSAIEAAMRSDIRVNRYDIRRG